MSCTRPLVRFSDGRVWKLKKFLEVNDKGIIKDYYDQVAEIKNERYVLEALKRNHAQLLPCGQCPACKMTAASSWANRMEMELPYHKNAWFLTLTYDDDHVPWSYNNELGIDINTGEVTVENLTLNFKDLQDFWKRLRRYMEYHGTAEYEIIVEEDGTQKLKPKFCYFASGEYGGKTKRPHYHAIAYDIPIKENELKVYKKKNGIVYYNCEWLNKIWGNGHLVIAPAEWKAMAYTARYTTKKIYGKGAKEKYLEMGILPEKCLMSKSPAIGARYYYDHAAEIYEKDKIQLKNGKVCKPPRYFDKLFDLEHSEAKPLSDKEIEGMEDTTIKAESEELKAIKRERRKIANDTLFAQLKQTGLTMQEYYNLKDAKMQERFKKLIREEI
jgi:hypothetical protein|nr:MAG TPA: Replication associated protein [Microviridae sp.]